MDLLDQPGSPVPERLRVPVLSAVAVAMTATAVAASWRLASLPTVGSSDVAIAAMALVAFALVERVVISLPMRRSAHAVTVDEIPLVIACALLPAPTVILVRMLGGVIGVSADTASTPFRRMYSLACYALSTAAAVTVYEATVGTRSVTSPATWPGLFLAMTTSSIVGIVAVFVALWIHDGQRSLPMANLAASLLVTLVNTTVGVIAAVCMKASPWTGLLMIAPVVVLAVAYRAWTRERVLRKRLAIVGDVIVAIARTERPEQALVTAMQRVAAALDARTIELEMQDDRRVLHRLTLHDGDVRPEPIGRVGVLEVGIHTDEGLLGTLRVGDRVGAAVTFSGEEQALMTALASQIGSALRRERIGAALESLEERAAELEVVANLDALTGVTNRRGMEQRLRELAPGHGAVIALDLDGFKHVNDTYGHPAGDVLLTLVAKRIVSACSASDAVCRLGGDEFVVIVDYAGNAEGIANRILETISRPFTVEGQTVRVGTSCGVSSVGFEPDHAHEALRRADAALYEAKRAGKGRVVAAAR